ncbi:MAG: hypothetical protein IKP60_08065 [Treponema sp.]|nr:hypothetical protein [Treponema sp.]
MTREEFRDAILVRRDFDFVYNNRRFFVNSKQTLDGGLEISFGEEYTSPKTFDSFTHLMADAKIDFKYLREILVDL